MRTHCTSMRSRIVAGDASIRALVDAIDSASKKLPSMAQLIPLPWLKIFDEFRKLSQTQPVATYDEAVALAKKHGMPHPGLTIEEEVAAVLKFLHSLNGILWYSENIALQELIVLEPQWVIDAATCIIRDHRLDDHAANYTRMKEFDQEAMRKYPEFWKALTGGSAILHGPVRRILWRHPSFNAWQEKLMELMMSFGLFIPVPGREDEHLVPSLLADAKVINVPRTWPHPCADAACFRVHFNLVDPVSDPVSASDEPVSYTHLTLPTKRIV